MMNLIRSVKNRWRLLKSSLLNWKKLLEEEMKKIRYEEEKINTELLKLDKELKQTKNKARESSPLLRFLNESITRKEKELECPVCFEVAQQPIFKRSESHLICCDCQPKLEKCPECRIKYNTPPKIHRYAIQMVEELRRIINEKKKLKS